MIDKNLDDVNQNITSNIDGEEQEDDNEFLDQPNIDINARGFNVSSSVVLDSRLDQLNVDQRVNDNDFIQDSRSISNSYYADCKYYKIINSYFKN